MLYFAPLVIPLVLHAEGIYRWPGPPLAYNWPAVSAPSQSPPPKTTVLFFTSASCQPCRQVKPLIDRLAESADYHVQVVDYARQPALFTQYRVTAVPTIVVVYNQRELARHVGVISDLRPLLRPLTRKDTSNVP